MAACSQSLTEEECNNNLITGQAVATEIMRACKYPDGEFCDERCCQVEEKCEDGSLAFMECDLKTGGWTDKTYANSKCASECEIAKLEEIENQEPKENKTLKSCLEGWKCLNKFEKIYRNADCSFGETERCSSGCVNDTCANLCTPGTFSCRNDILRKCDEDGNDWRYHMTCDYGCKNGQCVNSTEQTNQTMNQTKDAPESKESICNAECFSIVVFHYDAEGDDNNNENDEYVTIKNSCSFSCDLTGWEISDNSSHKYNFAAFNLGNGASFTLYTGEGTDTESNLYWNRGSAVWNNDGDTLYLKNQSSDIIFTESYS